tara:strand:- start:220 stop:387 length:168 start_codon:yes stop_codon:yes gene_type:complete
MTSNFPKIADFNIPSALRLDIWGCFVLDIQSKKTIGINGSDDKIGISDRAKYTLH